MLRTALRTPTGIGVLALAVVAAAGLWLVGAPFLLEYQEVGVEWIVATRQHVAAGVALLATCLLTAAALASSLLRTVDGRTEAVAGGPTDPDDT